MKIFNNIMTIIFKLSVLWFIFIGILASPEVYCILKHHSDIAEVQSWAHQFAKHELEHNYY